MAMNEKHFSHTINGKTYCSCAGVMPFDSLEDYRKAVRKAYGSLRGVTFSSVKAH